MWSGVTFLKTPPQVPALLFVDIFLVFGWQEGHEGQLPGDLRDLSNRFEAYIFVLPETKNKENRTMGIFKNFTLKSTCRVKSTNFKHQNSIENSIYLTDFLRTAQDLY